VTCFVELCYASGFSIKLLLVVHKHVLARVKFYVFTVVLMKIQVFSDDIL